MEKPEIKPELVQLLRDSLEITKNLVDANAQSSLKRIGKESAAKTNEKFSLFFDGLSPEERTFILASMCSVTMGILLDGSLNEPEDAESGESVTTDLPPSP